MIIDKKDIKELDRYIESFRQFENTDGLSQLDEPSVAFFGERPHLILPLGFDQSRCIPDPEGTEYYDAEYDPDFYFEAIKNDRPHPLYGIRGIDFTFGTEWLYRKSCKRSRSSGAWYWFEGLEKDHLRFRGPDADPRWQVSIDELFKRLGKVAASPDPTSRTLWLPSFWTPKHQNATRQFLDQRIPAILQEIYKEGKALRDIPPHELEELVAELLRDEGMEIHITPRTRDGGRDIIARGAFRGELMAVEVKQKKVVGVLDFRNAWKANEHYPALLIATSGRFSAGVFDEKKDKQHRFRLDLVDGVALSQWISMYVAKQKTPRARSLRASANKN